jgi:hypothetical protein
MIEHLVSEVVLTCGCAAGDLIQLAQAMDLRLFLVPQ